jgi:hypothetical protein
LPNEAEYTRALSLSRLAYDLEQLLSPSLAGIVLLVLSFDALFALDGVAFLISAAPIRSLPRPAAAEQSAGVLAKVACGVRLYLATPRLRGLLALSMAVARALPASGVALPHWHNGRLNAHELYDLRNGSAFGCLKADAQR